MDLRSPQQLRSLTCSLRRIFNSSSNSVSLRTQVEDGRVTRQTVPSTASWRRRDSGSPRHARAASLARLLRAVEGG